jgi:hypothetical protein
MRDHCGEGISGVYIGVTLYVVRVARGSKLMNV